VRGLKFCKFSLDLLLAFLRTSGVGVNLNVGLPTFHFLFPSLFLSALLSVSVFAGSSESLAMEETPVPRTYSSAQGDIDLGQLESAISQDADGADVRIKSVRWSKDPMAYGIYFLGKAFGSAHARYILDFELGNSHHVECVLLLFVREQDALIHRCTSDTADVSRLASVANFRELGLPQTSHAHIAK